MSETPPLTAPQPQPTRCGLATWSLVLGILSLTCFWIFTAIPAVICGHKALSRIGRSGGTLEGSGLAIGGLVTGYLSIAMLPIIALLAAIAIPNFVQARTTAQMNYCINNLRQIDAATQMWALDNKKSGSAVPEPADLTKYLGRDFSTFKCPAGGTYTLTPAGHVPTCSIPGHQLPEPR